LTHDESTHAALLEHGLPSNLWDGINNRDAFEAVLAARAIVCDTHLLSTAAYGADYHRIARHKPSLNLWHGIPIKDIGRHNHIYDNVMDLSHLEDSYRRWEFLIPSEKTLPAFSDAYPNSSFHIARYPRNLSWDYPDLRGTEINVDPSIMAQLAEDAEQNIMRVMFCPTFCDKPMNLISHHRVADLDPLLKKAGIRLYVKPHQHDHASVLPKERELSNIRLIGEHTDIYPLLPHSDVLITDISSILFDYALLSKPIFIVVPDDPQITGRFRMKTASLKFAEGLVRVATLDEIVEKLAKIPKQIMEDGLNATLAMRELIYNPQELSSVDRVSSWIHRVTSVEGACHPSTSFPSPGDPYLPDLYV
jgi:CDP-glycerol glycerophosphotransferase